LHSGFNTAIHKKKYRIKTTDEKFIKILSKNKLKKTLINTITAVR